MTKVNYESAQKLIGMLCEVEFDDGKVEFEVVDTFDFNDKTYALMMELESFENVEDLVNDLESEEDEVEGNGYLMIVNEDLTLSPIDGDGEFFAAAEYYQVMHLDGHDDEDEEEYDDYSDVEFLTDEDEEEE